MTIKKRERKFKRRPLYTPEKLRACTSRFRQSALSTCIGAAMVGVDAALLEMSDGKL